MNWKHWLNQGDLQRVHVSAKSLSDLVHLVDRDIRDAQIASLSLDRRFATAYNAALNLSNYVIRKNGYRVSAKVGHHRVTLLVVREALGRKADRLVNYFEVCRRKRNRVDYDLAGIVSETEVIELLDKVTEFKKLCGLS